MVTRGCRNHGVLCRLTDSQSGRFSDLFNLQVMTMQKMLLLIPLRVVNEVPTIRDYLLRGNTNVNSSSSKHGKEDRSRR